MCLLLVDDNILRVRLLLLTAACTFRLVFTLFWVLHGIDIERLQLNNASSLCISRVSGSIIVTVCLMFLPFDLQPACLRPGVQNLLDVCRRPQHQTRRRQMHRRVISRRNLHCTSHLQPAAAAAAWVVASQHPPGTQPRARNVRRGDQVTVNARSLLPQKDCSTQ